MWKVIEQEESIGKNKFSTKCKRLKFFPIEAKGMETQFGRLKFLLLQVIIQNDKGTELKVRLNGTDPQNPRFSLVHQDSEDWETYVVGKGKNRREFPDKLKPKVKVPGERERLGSPQELEKRLTQVAGVLVANEVLDLLASKFGTIVAQAA